MLVLNRNLTSFMPVQSITFSIPEYAAETVLVSFISTFCGILGAVIFFSKSPPISAINNFPANNHVLSKANFSIKSAISSAVAGNGVNLVTFLILLSIVIFLNSTLEFNRVTSVVYYSGVTLSLTWIFPFKEVGKLSKKFGYFLDRLGAIREQLHNIIPYNNDLLPFLPEMRKKSAYIIDNIEILGPAMPIMMKEKEFLLPVMDEIINKIEILLPIMDSILPNISKVAPKICLMLPKIELLAPHVKDIMPLWDDLEPRIDILVAEVDNIAPILSELSPYMDRLIPVLDLLPMIHETGIFKFNSVCKHLPTMTKFLPNKDKLLQRIVLNKVAVTVGNLHERGVNILRNHQNGLIEYNRTKAITA